MSPNFIGSSPGPAAKVVLNSILRRKAEWIQLWRAGKTRVNFRSAAFVSTDGETKPASYRIGPVACTPPSLGLISPQFA
jgi:hypothetical protein